MHLTDEQVQRLVDAQLSEAGGRPLEQHASECGDCHDRLTAARREADAILVRLALVDHPVPAVSADSVIRQARQRGAGVGRWAAAILLSLGLAGVAYAAPGSPLPGWVAAVSAWVTAEPAAEVSPVPLPSEPVPARAGIAVLPGERLTISLEIDDGGSARVSLTDDAEVTIRAESGGVGLTAGTGQLVVKGRAGPTSLEVWIPRSAPRVEIVWHGERLFLKAGDRIITVAAAGPDGSYRLSLGP